MEITKETLCPEKKCSDGTFLSYYQDYLINSVTSDLFFNEILAAMPVEYQTFVIGKTLFGYLTSTSESYRQYKNYVFLASENIKAAKNYNYLILQNRKTFNDCLEKIPASIANRLALIDYLIMSIPILTTVSDLKDGNQVTITTEMRNRLNYVISILQNSRNVFLNAMTSYTSQYPKEPIA